MHHDHEPRRVSFPLLMAVLLTLFLAGCAIGNRPKDQAVPSIQFAFHIDGTGSR